MGGKSDSIPVFAPLLATRLSVRLIGEFSWVAATPVVMETVAHGTQEAGPKWQKRDRVVPKYRFPIDRWLGGRKLSVAIEAEKKSPKVAFSTLCSCNKMNGSRDYQSCIDAFTALRDKSWEVSQQWTQSQKQKKKPASISLPSPLAPPTKSSEEECIK